MILVRHCFIQNIDQNELITYINNIIHMIEFPAHFPSIDLLSAKKLDELYNFLCEKYSNNNIETEMLILECDDEEYYCTVRVYKIGTIFRYNKVLDNEFNTIRKNIRHRNINKLLDI